MGTQQQQQQRRLGGGGGGGGGISVHSSHSLRLRRRLRHRTTRQNSVLPVFTVIVATLLCIGLFLVIQILWISWYSYDLSSLIHVNNNNKNHNGEQQQHYGQQDHKDHDQLMWSDKYHVPFVINRLGGVHDNHRHNDKNYNNDTATVSLKFMGDSQQQKQRQQATKTTREPQPKVSLSSSSSYQEMDGIFNGAPLKLKRDMINPQSNVHCVGDRYLHNDYPKNNNNDDDENDSWKGRSCQFSMFCFNTTSQRYVIYQSHTEQILHRFLDPYSSLMHVSSTVLSSSSSKSHSNDVSLGGINIKWGKSGIRRLSWFPDIKTNVTKLTYYELPTSIILIPFHSLNGANPGHLVWDDFLPIYNLLDMFHWLPSSSSSSSNNGQDVTTKLLLMRYILNNDNDENTIEKKNERYGTLRQQEKQQQQKQKQQRGLWASCDWTEARTKLCHDMINKFIPLLVGHESQYHWSTTRNFQFVTTTNNNKPPETDLVCASRGVAGIGALTDHGYTKGHGWVPEDYNFIYNYGRGGLFRSFRNFAIENLKLPPLQQQQQGQEKQEQEKRHRIVFSVNSSDIPVRQEDFTIQIDLVQQYVPSAIVESFTFQHLSLDEQINVARQTSIFITMCGGGAVTSMFVPPGSSIILFYHEHGGIRAGHHGNEPTNTSAMLDWDLFTSLTHVRVHWMPKLSMNQISNQMAFVSLIHHELAIMDSKVFG